MTTADSLALYFLGGFAFGVLVLGPLTAWLIGIPDRRR